MSSYWPYVRRFVYLLVLLALVIFLLRQGSGPWLALASHPGTFLAVMLVTAASLFVQANTFRMCLPDSARKMGLLTLVRAWAAGGVTGLVAPLFAGFAMRTAVLKSKGVSVSDSALGTLRQTLFNVEYSLLAAAAVLLINPWEQLPELGLILFLLWLLWLFGRRMFRHRAWLLPERFRPSAAWLLSPPKGRLIFWLCGLLALMSMNYQVAFLGFGAGLELHESILLASLTVLMSVAAMVPNGLGVLEVLWIWIARHQGLEMSDSVGLALLLRLAYLCSASLLWTAVSLLRPGNGVE